MLEENGRPTLFETGAIVFDVAGRTSVLLPADANERTQAIMSMFAALNSVEPFLTNLAEVEFFMEDEAAKAERRPAVLAMSKRRLGELQAALGDRRWLVDREFTVADLMVPSVLKIAASLDVLDGFPGLVAYRARCFYRPAYRKAIADQCAAIARHEMADMRYDAA